MRFLVEHTTRFSYDRPVSLGPVTVRLRPRDDGAQRVARFRMDVEPEPRARSEILDGEGNAATRLWFGDTTERLMLRVSSETETFRANPYEYVLDPQLMLIPAAYPAAEAEALARYRIDEGSSAVAAFARDTLEQTSHRTTDFLSGLALRISKEVTQRTRDSGEPQAPEQTIALGEGACRDHAMLFVAAARATGLAARFVSGYQEPQAGFPIALHAWAEVFLPEAGWRGYDPSAGVAVSDRHVAVATAAQARAAAPTEGSYSPPAEETLTATLDVRVQD